MRKFGWVGRIAAACMALMPMVAVAGEATQSRVYTFQVELDASGALVSATALRDAQDVTVRTLQEDLRNWVFQPAQQDGRAVPTTTWVRVAAIPSTDGTAPRVLSATAGPAPDTLRKPEFPAAAQRRGHSGVVVLELQTDAQGRVSAVSVRDTVGSINRAMAEAAVAAARDWTFRPERVAGVPLAGKLLMPVCFVAASDLEGCEWMGPESRAYGRDTVLALEPAARLAHPVAFSGP